MKFFPDHRILSKVLKGAWQPLAQMLLFFYVLHSVKFKKLFPIVGIVVEYVHYVCPISIHLWNVYLLPPELAGLECDPHHVIFRFPFSNRNQTFLLYRSFFREIFAKECTSVGLLYLVWHIKTRMTVEFVIIWYLDLLLLYESAWGMRSDTISSSSSASAANYFNFWSKVGFFVSCFSNVHFLNWI